MDKTTKNTSVLILAAGNSKRMGKPKFLLEFDQNRCFLQKIIEDYRAQGYSNIKIVLNTKNAKRLTKPKLQFIDKNNIILNPYPEEERFYSIKLGIEALQTNNYVFIHPVDTPCALPEVINLLIQHQSINDYVVPVYEGKGGHPILIGKKIIREILKIQDNFINFKVFINNFNRVEVEVKHKEILLNINTIDDFKTFQALKHEN